MIFLLLLVCFTRIVDAQVSASITLNNGFFYVENLDNYELQVDSIFKINEKDNSTYYLNRIKVNTEKSEITLYARKNLITSTSYKRDSLIYAELKECFEPSRLSKAKLISYKISPLQQNSEGYKYVDIFKTTYRDNGYS